MWRGNSNSMNMDICSDHKL